MRFISTKTHGVLDYIMGILLIAAPWLLDFANDGAAQWIPVAVGAVIILMSLLTDYEFGAKKSISMSTHLTMDVVAGIFLAVSPWLFGFSDFIFWPHLILGILEVGAGFMTHTTPGYAADAPARA